MSRQILMFMALTAGIFMLAGFILNRQLRRDTMLAARVRASNALSASRRSSLLRASCSPSCCG